MGSFLIISECDIGSLGRILDINSKLSLTCCFHRSELFPFRCASSLFSFSSASSSLSCLVLPLFLFGLEVFGEPSIFATDDLYQIVQRLSSGPVIIIYRFHLLVQGPNLAVAL